MSYGETAVPVIDLRKRFELDAPIREETRMMVLELDTQRVAVLVDEVREVLRVDSTAIAAPGPIVSGLAAVYIAGIVTRPGRTILILNAAGSGPAWGSINDGSLLDHVQSPTDGYCIAARCAGRRRA
jgi:chemotaxis signal transduction protein